MTSSMDFERPVIELKEKIAELKSFMDEKDIDLSGEVQRLEERLESLEAEVYGDLNPWDRVQISRHSDRPTTLAYVNDLFRDFVECHGDRLYGDDEAIVAGIAKYHHQPVTIIGQQRGRDTKENIRRNFGMPHPEGYRKALRLMKQAEKFGRPVISFIDTKGAYPGKSAEERGISEAIAQNLFEMAGLTVPIVSLVIGEGGSGGALGIGISNHIHMLENSWYSVIAPESAASLLWKDATQGERAAETMKITAPDWKSLGILDEIIPEPKGGAHHDPADQAQHIDKVLWQSIQEFSQMSKAELLEQRRQKYKNIGIPADEDSSESVK